MARRQTGTLGRMTIKAHGTRAAQAAANDVSTDYRDWLEANCGRVAGRILSEIALLAFTTELQRRAQAEIDASES